MFTQRFSPDAYRSAAVGDERTRLLFRLDLTAGGMAGPVLNMLIAPLLRPVAEDLANGIAERIERRH